MSNYIIFEALFNVNITYRISISLKSYLEIIIKRNNSHFNVVLLFT